MSHTSSIQVRDNFINNFYRQPIVGESRFCNFTNKVIRYNKDINHKFAFDFNICLHIVHILCVSLGYESIKKNRNREQSQQMFYSHVCCGGGTCGPGLWLQTRLTTSCGSINKLGLQKGEIKIGSL